MSFKFFFPKGFLMEGCGGFNQVHFSVNVAVVHYHRSKKKKIAQVFATNCYLPLRFLIDFLSWSCALDCSHFK